MLIGGEVVGDCVVYPATPVTDVCIQLFETNASQGIFSITSAFDGYQNSNTIMPAFTFASDWAVDSIVLHLRGVAGAPFNIRLTNITNRSKTLVTSTNQHTLTPVVEQPTFNFDDTLNVAYLTAGEVYVVELPPDVEWKYRDFTGASINFAGFKGVSTANVVSNIGAFGNILLRNANPTVTTHQFNPTTCQLGVGVSGMVVCIENIVPCI